MRGPRLSALELSLLGVVVAVLVGAALIGSSDEKETHSGGQREKAQVTGPQVSVGRIERRVERLRQLRFRRPLHVKFATPSEMSSLFRKAAAEERSSPREERADEEALKLLGLLAPSDNLARALRAVEDEQVSGFYDFRSKRLVVKKGPGDSRGLEEIVLAHELTHALEDQHFRLGEGGDLGDDGALAESALFEGTATALMTDYADRYLDLTDLLDVLGDVSGTDSPLPRFVEHELVFPYEAGESFVDAFRQGGSWRAVDQVMRLRRPASTEQVIHPELYAANERPLPMRLAAIARRLRGGWRRVESSTVGELDLRLLFRLVGKVDHPARAAKGWGGGRFELRRRGSLAPASCAAPCIARDVGIMKIAWDSRRDRGEGEAALSEVIASGLHGTRSGAHGGVLLWSSRGGTIGLRGERRETTVVFAPSPSLAERLLAGA